MKKVLKAREIVLPDNLPELLDKRAGRPEGELRNILADNGKLREIDTELLKIAISFEVKNIMQTEVLPEKPMSLQRFCTMMWVVTIAYVLGTFHFDDRGSLDIGHAKDVGFVSELFDAEEFQFRNGKKVRASSVMPVIQLLTSEKSLKKVYDDIAGKGMFKRKELSIPHSLQLAETIIEASEKMVSLPIWD